MKTELEEKIKSLGLQAVLSAMQEAIAAVAKKGSHPDAQDWLYVYRDIRSLAESDQVARLAQN